MQNLSLLIGIFARDKLPEVLRLYKGQQLEVTMIALGHGTATNETLNMLGLESTEKAVCFSFVTGEHWKTVKTDLERKLRIDVPGTGVAFTVPLSSIGLTPKRSLDIKSVFVSLSYIANAHIPFILSRQALPHSTVCIVL